MYLLYTYQDRARKQYDAVVKELTDCAGALGSNWKVSQYDARQEAEQARDAYLEYFRKKHGWSRGSWTNHTF